MLAMLNLPAAIRIEQNTEKTDDSRPDCSIFADETTTDIDGGWNATVKSSGKPYVSLRLSDPEIGPRVIYANLVPVKGKQGRYVMLWNPGST
ncbi:MAG: DUF736 family protein [Pseudomonadota bacterium]